VVDDLNTIPKALRGRHARYPVNLPRDGGVQLEMSHTARLEPHRGKVVTAVAELVTRQMTS
jgi:phage replication-related protein YjqB (UPF0714/DUF867 family)